MPKVYVSSDAESSWRSMMRPKVSFGGCEEQDLEAACVYVLGSSTAGERREREREREKERKRERERIDREKDSERE